MSTSQGFQINWLASTGSALGAVSSAVLLSTLGAAGTIFGAALGSLIITVGGSIYTQSLEKTKRRVEDLRLRDKRAAETQNEGSTVASSHAPAPTAASTATDIPEETSRRSLPWKRIIGFSVALFVVAMAIILAFELATGRPVSSYTGGAGSGTETGTTFSELGSSSGTTDETEAESTGDETAGQEEPPEEEGLTEEQPAEEEPADAPAEDPPAEAPPAQSEE